MPGTPPADTYKEKAPTNKGWFHSSSPGPHVPPSPRYRCLQVMNLPSNVAAELLRTLYALIALIVFGMFLTFNIQWSDQRWKHSGDDMKPLPDLLFTVLSDETDRVWLADLFMVTLFASSLVINLFLAESNIARIIIVRRLLWTLTILLTFRCATLSVTTLPAPKNCSPVDTGGFFFMLGQGVQIILGDVKACTDNIYSGHTVFLTTSVILFRLYCKIRIIKYYAYAHYFVGLMLIVWTRLHYTVDVLLAMFITYAVHSIYYNIVDLCVEKHFLNIRRAEERLGDPQLYQRLAYMPCMFNTSLFGAVRWMDGLDIRFAQEDQAIVASTRELAQQRQRAVVSVTSSSSRSSSPSRSASPSDEVPTAEMTEVVVSGRAETGEPSRRAPSIHSFSADT